jgi:hypothetical protein
MPKLLLLIGVASPAIAYLNLHLFVFAGGVAGCVVYLTPNIKIVFFLTLMAPTGTAAAPALNSLCSPACGSGPLLWQFPRSQVSFSMICRRKRTPGSGTGIQCGMF